MRVKIQGKTFDIDLYEDHVFILEYNKYGKRWIRIPLGVIKWVTVVLELCSSFEYLSFEKRFGSLFWRISTRRNKWGWVLEIGVRIKGNNFSIFVPGESSFQPWSRFINSFYHVMSGKGNLLKHDIEFHSDSVASLISDMEILPNRDVDLFDENRSFKEGVDGLLANEYLCFTSRDASSCNSLPNSQEIFAESIGQVGANNFVVQDFDISDMMEEAKEIRDSFLMSDNAFLSSGHYIDVVTSLPYIQGGRKKNKPSSIAVVQIVDRVVSEVGPSNIKPTMSARMNKRRSLFVDHESCWDKLPKGVKKHSISKYGELPNIDISREWLIEALELDDEASDGDIVKRVYQFQKMRKIKISKKIIRIFEGVHNEGLRKLGC